MKDNRLDDLKVASAFVNDMAVAVCVTRADDYRILYANDYLINLAGCSDYDDFMDYTGGIFDGMVDEAQIEVLHKDFHIETQSLHNSTGYAFYNTRKKSGKLIRVVNHWTLYQDPEEGVLVFATIYPHKYENTSTDYDAVTALYTRQKFKKHLESTSYSDRADATKEYAIVYVNLVNFKFINIDRGVTEGDLCLKTMANILINIYKDGVISRVADDHFAVFTAYDGVMERTEEADRLFSEKYGNHNNVIGKFGIYKLPPTYEIDVESALSQAKVACDYIKSDVKTDIIEYNAELEKNIKTAEYVTAHIDEAIERGWIKIYFQPVIRSLTEGLCGLESLVRWIDPKIGFLPPDQFISTLERERCIHKLDCYVVDQVCRTIRERVDHKIHIVPVSVNFSRLDFIMCDMLSVVESAVEKYDIPREYIHIEITESMISSDEELMHSIIEDFRKAGYEVWMDDFGSGYSSLTVLKDFQFDTLKLDMRFLYPFTDKSKSIVSSTISMAKEIGMHTVAEGVETKEQLEFLKDTGCEMIQGYYYGRPEPIEDVFVHLEDKAISTETRKWRHFFETASMHVRVTDEPLEIIEVDGKSFRTLFMNRSYREQIFDKEMSLEEIDNYVYNSGTPLFNQFRKFVDQIERSKKPQTFFFTAKNNYYRFTGQTLVKNGSHYIIQGSIFNITHDKDMSAKTNLDVRLRELNLLFDSVLIGNIKEDTLKPLLGGYHYVDFGDEPVVPLREAMLRVEGEHIYPLDLEKYKAFFNIDDIAERVEKSGRGYVEEMFRFKQENGDYQWKEIYLMRIPGSNGDEYMFCMKSCAAVYSDRLSSDDTADTDGALSNLLRTFLWNSDVRFFWKDRERRFCGASQSFLDYHGVSSFDEIKGRTAEEVGWNHGDTKPIDMEYEILTKGTRFIDVPGKIIARGKVRDTLYSMIPLYQGEKIVGLAGYFDDVEDKLAKIDARNAASRIDSVTGVMNSRAFVDEMIDRADMYNESGTDYGLIVLNNTTHWRIVETYGQEFADKVLHCMADTIVKTAGRGAAVARTKEAVFVVMCGIKDRDGFISLAEKIKKALSAIIEVEGNRVTMRIKLSAKIRSEESTYDEAIYELALKDVM